MTKSVAENIGRVPATQVKNNGPRTARGKAASSKNARKHGLTSKDVVLPGESAKEFEHFRNEIVADLGPVGAIETNKRIPSIGSNLERTHQPSVRKKTPEGTKH